MEYLGYYICGALILVCIIISVVAQARVYSANHKYSKTASSLDMTGAELARELARRANISVNIRSTGGSLSDHYDPRDKSINISQANHSSKSISAQAIVAHEFGHALQDSENYFPFKIRQVTVKISNFVSRMFIPVILLGFLFEILWFTGVGNIIIYAYVGIYVVSFIVSLVTLPVEFNASRRAKKLLVQEGLTEQEMDGVHDVLNAAAMTYVASFMLNLVYLLRFFFLLKIFSRD